MSRLLGEPQTTRTFWLVLLLAVMLLLGVSTSPAKSTGAADSRVSHAVGTLLAFGEALQASQAQPLAFPIHPELAGGGSAWLRDLSVRQVRALQRSLITLEDGAGLAGGSTHHALAGEVDRLHRKLLAFESPEDDPVLLGQSFARLASPGAAILSEELPRAPAPARPASARHRPGR